MKKNILYILFLVICICSACQNELPFHNENHTPKLILNTLLAVEGAENKVHLNLTGPNHSTLPTGAYVLFQVNDNTPETAEDLRNYDLTEETHAFRIHSQFRPGDRLRIDAYTTDKQHHVWAETQVPHIIPIEKVDTTYVTLKKSDQPAPYIQCKVTFQDPANQKNYYRLLMEQKYTANLIHLETGTSTTYTFSDYTIEIREDVVLTDGYPIIGDEDDELFGRPRNTLGIFDDARINGSTYTLTAYTPVPDLSYLRYYIREEYEISHAHVDLYVRLQSITETEFHYMSALNLLHSDSYSPILNEPIHFPTNVQGGTGIMGVSGESSVKLELADETMNYTED